MYDCIYIYTYVYQCYQYENQYIIHVPGSRTDATGLTEVPPDCTCRAVYDRYIYCVYIYTFLLCIYIHCMTITYIYIHNYCIIIYNYIYKHVYVYIYTYICCEVMRPQYYVDTCFWLLGIQLQGQACFVSWANSVTPVRVDQWTTWTTKCPVEVLEIVVQNICGPNGSNFSASGGPQSHIS